MSDDWSRKAELFRRRKWLIVHAALAVAVATGVVSGLRTPVYEAQARILLHPGDPSELLDRSVGARLSADASRHVRAQEDIASSEPVAREAARLLGWGDSEEIGRRVSVRHTEQSDILILTARHIDPGSARDVANAVARSYLENRRQTAVAGLDKAIAGVEGQLEPLLATLADLEVRLSKLDAGAAPVLRPPERPAGPPAPDPPGTAGRLSGSELPSTSEGLKAARYAAAVQYEELYGHLQRLRVERDLKKGEAELIAEAVLPRSPASPRPLRDAAVGGLVGLFLSIAYVLVRDRVDDRVRTVEEVEALTGLPILAELPYDAPSVSSGSIAAVDRPGCPLSESVRALRTSIHYLGATRPLRTVVVTSAAPGEGKSLVSANTAVMCAQAGRRTVLVSADLRRPAPPLSFLADTVSSPGLTELVAGHPESPLNLGQEADPDPLSPPNGRPGGVRLRTRPANVLTSADVAIRTKVPKLAYVPPGTSPPNPAELLASDRMTELLTELCGVADLVVLDTPPLLAVTDASVLAARADGVVLVVALGESRRDEVVRALRILDQTGGRILGTVVNKARSQSRRYDYNYGSGERRRRRTRSRSAGG